MRTLLEYLKYLIFEGKSGNHYQPSLLIMTLIWRVRIVKVTKIVMMRRSSVDLGHQFCSCQGSSPRRQGCVNPIRAMTQNPHKCAPWGDTCHRANSKLWGTILLLFLSHIIPTKGPFFRGQPSTHFNVGRAYLK